MEFVCKVVGKFAVLSRYCNITTFIPKKDLFKEFMYTKVYSPVQTDPVNDVFFPKNQDQDSKGHWNGF